MKVNWTEPALEDLEAIQAYITKDSNFYARQFIERIFDAAKKLETFPEIGRRKNRCQRIDISRLPYYLFYPARKHLYNRCNSRTSGFSGDERQVLAGQLMLDKPGTGLALGTKTGVGLLSDISAFDKETAVGKPIVVLIFNYRNVGHKKHARPGLLSISPF